MYEEQNRQDLLLLKSVRNNDNQESFAILFNKYFNLTFVHLIQRFKKVRRAVLQDVAIETVEYFYFEKLYDENWGNYPIYWLFRHAREMVFNLIRPSYYKNTLSFSEIGESEDDSYIDQLVYNGVDRIEKNNDLAKITFQLKSKVDKYIGELDDKNYTILTMYLDGENQGKIGKSLNINKNSIGSSIKAAFNQLKALVFDEKTFVKMQRLFLSFKGELRFPETCKMYFEDELNYSTISDILNIKKSSVVKRIQKDSKTILTGQGGKVKTSERHKLYRTESFYERKELYINNKNFQWQDSRLMKLYFEDELSYNDISAEYHVKPSILGKRVRREIDSFNAYRLKQKFNKP